MNHTDILYDSMSKISDRYKAGRLTWRNRQFIGFTLYWRKWLN